MRWAARIPRIGISVITVEEIWFGRSSKPKPRVLAWFERFLDEHCDVIPVTPDIARRSGQLRGQRRSTGRARTQPDLLIAATATVHGLIVVTRNETDFEGCAVGTPNPCTAAE